MAEKTRKTPEEIKSEILSQLKSGPKTITEIGENVGSNWLTIEKFLNELKDDGKILEVISNAKMKVYRRTDDLAYYGLPFSEEVRNRSASLLFTIADKWRSETDSIPSKTILQKIAVELIETSSEIKDIPVLRFHYGKTLALRYDETFKGDYEKFSLTPKQEKLLLGIIQKYKGMSPHQAQLKQYENEDMKFYYEKEANVIKGFSEPDHKKLENSLLRLSIYYPLDLENTFELFDRFIYCSIVLLNTKDADKTGSINRIREIFYLLWDTITTNYFFFEAEKHIVAEKKDLFAQIKLSVLNPKIANLTTTLDDLESEVNAINQEKINKPHSEKAQRLLHELLED